MNDRIACARFSVASEFGRENVPKDLFPHEIENSRKILEKLRKQKQNSL
ncbi:MAG: hypothetical protein ACYTFY_06795 [Planctomycetota bacterium]|jgi:hypothetical protein